MNRATSIHIIYVDTGHVLVRCKMQLIYIFDVKRNALKYTAIWCSAVKYNCRQTFLSTHISYVLTIYFRKELCRFPDDFHSYRREICDICLNACSTVNTVGVYPHHISTELRHWRCCRSDRKRTWLMVILSNWIISTLVACTPSVSWNVFEGAVKGDVGEWTAHLQLIRVA